jgi:endo-1,4-beta-xylanase
VGDLTVPDPRVTNPELFDLRNPDAPIPQFVNAMKNGGIDVSAEQIAQGITYVSTKADGAPLIDKDGNPFVVAVYNLDPDPTKQGETLEGPIPLAIAQKGENGGWTWKEFTLKNSNLVVDFTFGAHGIARRIKDVPNYAPTLAKNYNLVMSDSEFWMKVINEKQGDFSFDKAQTIENFADENGMQVLVLHLVPDENRHYPEWLTSGQFITEELQKLLTDYVTQTMGKFKGNTWSVVNESFESKNNPWYRAFGNDYIKKAFEIARAADPSATLIYNDYDIESNPSKLNQVYNLVSDLKQQGLIDGLGTQMHIDGSRPPNKQKIIEAMQKFKVLGLRVQVTEFDVDMTNVGGTEQQKLIKQAQIYHDVLSACLESGNCSGFTTYGFSDSVSIFGDNKSPEALAAMPLPFDSDFNPKLAYYGMLKTIYEYLMSY